MKVLHVINCLNKGGAEKLLVDILPKYENLSFAVLELTDQNSFGAYRTSLINNGIPCFSLGKNKLRAPVITFKLRSFLQKHRFDIVHVHLFPASYHVSLACRSLIDRPKVVFTEHSTSNKRRSRKYMRPIEKYIYRGFDKVIAISEKVRSELEAWTGIKNICLIKNGLDTKKIFTAQPYDNSFFEKEMNISDSSFKLFMTARFSYPKDQSTVVRALKLLPENIHAFFIGDGNLKTETEREVEEFQLGKRVHFLGFRTDVPSLIKSADINILSSAHEGMSGVTLEALAAGKPFLGSNVPGINDIVPDSRFLFKTKDEIDLAFKIQEIINKTELQSAMIKEGLNTVAKFDIEIMVNEHIRLYNSLLRQQSA